MRRFYLDANASTPLDPGVQAVMERVARNPLGNASSVHAEGRRARGEIDLARDAVAEWLGARPSEIIFTGGGTESCNLAVQGIALAQAPARRHVVTAATEHHAVLHACAALKRHHGFRVTYLPVDARGGINSADLESALSDQTALVSIMSANNESGVLQPIPELAAICAERSVYFHTDWVQSAGRETIDLRTPGLTALSLTAHKMHGPVGVGVLWLRSGVPLRRLMEGGAHENERRPGTENVVAIAGLREAVARYGRPSKEEQARQRAWIEALWADLQPLGGLVRNGDPVHRLSNTLNFSVAGIEAEELLIGCDLAGLALSSGSACLVGSVQPSHVLAAMGVAPELARGTVRLSIDGSIQDADRPEIGRRLRAVIDRQRALRGWTLGCDLAHTGA